MNNQIQTGRIRLSKRLQMSADYVRRGCAAADVGCDHAYMAIYLVQNRIAGRVIAMDINEGPLSRARQNVIQYGLEERIEIRRSDGIRELRPGEADTLLCAGMGGRLMIRILSEGREAADAAEEWILQPQSELLQVRRYIRESGYRIADESMCVEEGKYYTSLHAVKQDGSFREPREDRLGDQFGRPLLDRRDLKAVPAKGRGSGRKDPIGAVRTDKGRGRGSRQNGREACRYPGSAGNVERLGGCEWKTEFV